MSAKILSMVLGFGLASLATSFANAQPAPAYLTDSAYIAASRCAGLAEGLGSDAAAFNKVVSDQEGARSNYIVDTAQAAKDDAVRLAKSAGPDRRSQLAAERDGACKVYLGAA